jgi:FkbM family methyltransferase
MKAPASVGSVKTFFLTWMVRWYRAPDHPAKLRLWGYVWRVLGNPSFEVPYGRGGKMIVRGLDVVERSIMCYGNFEPEVWEALSAYVVGREVLWDVGAHVGTFTVLASQDERIMEVHAFEPNPETFRKLARHLRINETRNVTAHPLGLGSHRATLVLAEGDETNTGTASFQRPQDGRLTMSVPCESGDRLVYEAGLPAPTLMKVDVEGWERPVFEGMARVFVERPPKAIVFEADADAKGAILDTTLVSLLQQRGYEITHIRRPEGLVSEKENYLASRSVPRRDGEDRT